MKQILIKNLVMYVLVSCITSIITGINFSENSYPIFETIVGVSSFVFPFIFVFGTIPHLIYELTVKKKYVNSRRLYFKACIYAISILLFFIITGRAINLLFISISSAGIYFILDELLHLKSKKAH